MSFKSLFAAIFAASAVMNVDCGNFNRVNGNINIFNGNWNNVNAIRGNANVVHDSWKGVQGNQNGHLGKNHGIRGNANAILRGMGGQASIPMGGRYPWSYSLYL